MVWINKMAGLSLKDLYVAANLEELNKHAEVKKAKTTAAKQLFNSTKKLLEEAEKSNLNGDEELAYVYYYRYFEAVKIARQKDEYKKDKDFYDKLVPNKEVNAVFKKLEKISDNLEKRYKLKEEIRNLESASKDREYSDALENEKNLHNKSNATNGTNGKPLSAGDTAKSISSLNGVVKANGVEVDNNAKGQSGGMTTKELKILLEQKTKRILLVDCRDHADFVINHINHSNCICIPATTVAERGMSAAAILNKLKQNIPESYMDWNKRDTFDHIILYDWNSSIDNRQQGLATVYDALTRWDPNSKRVDIQVIQGGIKQMWLAYPSFMTNPQTVNKLNGSMTALEDPNKKLDSVSYPDLDDRPKPQPKPPSSAPAKNSTYDPNVPKSTNSADSNNHHLTRSVEVDVNDVPNSSGGGGIKIDRTTKPSRFSSNIKISNGEISNDLNRVNHSAEISSKIEKTETKAKEYSQALDAVIASSKNAVKNEHEIDELKDKVNKTHDRGLEALLKTKEEENQAMKKELEKKGFEVNKIKAQYEALLRESKSTLPRIKKPSEEEEIIVKEKEKEQLLDTVTELQNLRQKKDEEKREELRKLEQESGSTSKFPPLNNSATGGPVAKINSGIGITKLPAINNSATTLGGIPPPNSANGNPSSNLPPSSLRPISQDSSGITRQKLKDEGSDHPRSSSLKRSHSHPNIAQSHEEDMGDDLPTRSQVPGINRSLKPTSHRAPEVTTPRRFARNFEVVSSTERSKTGLKNLGNTCYMNSIIQCLSHTFRLVEYLRNEDYLKEWHPSRSPTKGEATEELAAAVKQMHSGHRSISLLDLKSTIGKHHRSFRGYEQQDSHEFITILLDWMHEEMNRVQEKTPLKEQKNDGLTDEVASCRAWDDYKKSNNSKISELFCGQQKSCVTCVNCNRASVTFEPFFILSVPIPSPGKKCDIQQCIDFYTTEEALQDWNCVHCKRKVRATKKIDLWKLPPYLIIHLQRFYNDGYWKKRLTEIDFPIENLNLNQRVLRRPDSITERPYDYQLYGVSNHYGSMDGGHYTAYCRGQPGVNWWKFDDQEVCHINSRDVPTAAAYILFYQNRNC